MELTERLQHNENMQTTTLVEEKKNNPFSLVEHRGQNDLVVSVGPILSRLLSSGDSRIPNPM